MKFHTLKALTDSNVLPGRCPVPHEPFDRIQMDSGLFLLTGPAKHSDDYVSSTAKGQRLQLNFGPNGRRKWSAAN